MAEKDINALPYKLQEEQEIANLVPDPTGDKVLTIHEGHFLLKHGESTLTCAILVLGKDLTCPPDTSALKAFKKMGKVAMYEVPEAGTAAPTKIVNFDNFVSGIASHPASKISAEGVFSIQGHDIPFYTHNHTVKTNHGPVTIAENEAFQKSKANVRHLSGNVDSENLIKELDSADLSYFRDPIRFAKKDVRVHDFQQLKTGETAIQKDILMFLPFSKFLPIIGLHKNPLRNTKQTRDVSFLMASRSLLAKKEVTVCGDGTYPFPGITTDLEQKADVVLKFSTSTAVDELNYIVKYFKYRKNIVKTPFCMRLRLSPQVSWNKIHSKFPHLQYFRTGYLAGPYFGVFWDGTEAETISPFKKMSILLSTETQIARYYLAKDLLDKEVQCKITKSVMSFSICTNHAKGAKRVYLELDEFILNDDEQPEIEVADPYELESDGEDEVNPNSIFGAGPGNSAAIAEPPTQKTFDLFPNKSVAGSVADDLNTDDDDLDSYLPKEE